MMDLIEALRTTGAVRGFTHEPVSDEVVAAILDDARFAPSGGNQQPWRVAVVRDPAIRQAVAELMRPVWQEYAGAQAAGKRAFAFGRSTGDPPLDVPNPLIDHIVDVPVVLAVAADLRKVAIMDGNVTHRPAVVGGASIYPFCWSILLAAREHGLGGVLTTFLARNEAAAANVLGLPEHHALVATIFLGVPLQRATRLRRHPVGSFTTVDRFDGPPLG
jgi:nitroreductase